MKSTYARFIYIECLLVVLVAFLLQGCSEPPEPEVKEVSRPVKLMTLGDSALGAVREYPGTIAAVQDVELGFEVPGKLVELPIIEGQKVNQGELLARLDPADYKAARDAARSNRQALSAAYTRAKKIFDQGAGSQSEVDRALRDIQVAQEELKKAQKALDDTALKAPFSGEVARKMVENFQNVQAKQPVVLLQDISSLEMEVTVPEQDFARAKVGLSNEERTARVRPEIEISAIPDQRFPARFKSISTAADPVTRTYKVKFSFDNPPDISILPGMTARVILHLPGDTLKAAGMDGFMVPVSAVAADEKGKSYAWRVDPNSMKITRVPVELGTITGSEVRVLSGLKQGDLIPVSGVHHLREGMTVRPLGQ